MTSQIHIMPQKNPRETSKNDVGEALALLSGTLVEEEARIRDEGADAMKAGAYDTATEVIEFAKKLLAFQRKVADLEAEWGRLENARDEAAPAVQAIVSKKFFGRKRKGDITTRKAYYKPLLQALVDLGGSAPIQDVLDRVGIIMKPTLKPKDYEPMSSDKKMIRWRNSTMWARSTMVNEDGRMKAGSPHGIWEISVKGREWLEANN